MVTTAGYGRWASPLAPAQVARAKVSLSELCSDGAALYWLESRPAEAGRVVFVRAADAHQDRGRDEPAPPADHSPPGVSIRSRVNEYGGGAVCLVPGHAPGAFAYVEHTEQRVWFCDGTGAPDAPDHAEPRPLSAPPPEGERHNHGGLAATPDGEWVLAVREVHAAGSPPPSPCRAVVAYATRTDATWGDAPPVCVLLEGHDFFGAPRADPSGTRLAVVVWDHPDMPWDASMLLVAPLHQSGTEEPGAPALRVAADPWPIAGGPGESVGQPAWADDGALRYVSDRRGWWQPYRHPGGPDDSEPTRLSDEEVEFHGPDWVLGQSTMADLPDGTVVARCTRSGRDALVALPPTTRSGSHGTRTPARLEQPCVAISALCAHGEGLALIGTTPEEPPGVWVWSPAAGARPARPAAAIALDRPDVAAGESFTLEGRTGRPVHGTLYRPHLHGSRGPARSAPPLITWCHGGPTAACPAGLDPTVQFFTTRGFAVACVDYAGSSGYGRAYRCSLWGQWGVADAEDCLDAALHLAARHDVDATRMAVRGSSAGGMTALNTLASGDGFTACTSWYGVTDLLGLVASTHDFEAHYTDRLIGPLPEARALYEERSPVQRAAAMRDGAVLLLQGTDDAVVPPAQAEAMRDALQTEGARCDLRFFDGEGHGFRRADTLTACLEAELAFYLRELRL